MLQEVFTNVSIVVDDVNDNAPQFSQEEYVFTMDEESPPGTVAGKVVATDADLDTGGQVAYHIKQGKGSEVFKVDKVCSTSE